MKPILNLNGAFKYQVECMNIYREIKKNNVLPRLMFMLILLFTLLASISCSTNNDGFQKAVVTKLGIRFSFEYPSSYQDKNRTLKDNTYVANSILLARVDNNNTWDNSDTQFRISIIDKSIYPSAKACLDATVQNIKRAYSSNQIEVINNSEKRIASIDGYILEYNAVYAQQPHALIYLFFDYQDFVWSVYMDARGSVAGQAKSEFEHIVDTFQFVQ